MVLNPNSGAIVDVWMYKTNNGDYTTSFKKQYVKGKHSSSLV